MTANYIFIESFSQVLCFTVFVVAASADYDHGQGQGHGHAYSSQHVARHDGPAQVVHVKGHDQGHGHGHEDSIDYYVSFIISNSC